MNSYLPFVVAGVASGSIYSMAATGLVLTYKTSGIFNFGHGALATAAAYLFYFLTHDCHINWVFALIIAVFVAGPIMGLMMEGLARELSQQRTAWKIVGTIGLILIVEGLAVVKYGSDRILVDQFLPKAEDSFTIFGTAVLYPQLFVTCVSIIAVLLLYGLFKWSRLGVAMRAVVDDPNLVAMQGSNPSGPRRSAWLIGCTFAALSGVLVLPFIGLDSIALTFLVVEAFGAAAVGAFSNIPLTFAGGLIIGILSSLSSKLVSSGLNLGSLHVSGLSLAGLPQSLPFVFLFIVLLVTPKRKLLPASSVERRPTLQWRAPGSVRGVAGILLLIVLILIPNIVGSTHLGAYTIGLTQGIIMLSLGLLIRTSGQVSLCQSTFSAIGAVVFSQFAVDHHLPWLLALFLACLVVVPVGAIIAIPAIRLSGLFLALATFGFAILVEQLLYQQGFMFTKIVSGRSVPRPSFAEGDRAYYYLVLAFVVLVALFIILLHRARLGRMLRGMSESEAAISTLGLSTTVTRVLVFATSSFIAAMGGVLYSGEIHFAVANDNYFTAFNSLILVAILALAPFREPWYAIFAIPAAVIPSYLSNSQTPAWLNVAFGVFALMASITGGPHPMPMRARQFIERIAGRARTLALDPDRSTGPVRATPARRAAGATGLSVVRLGVRFGGLVAVDNVSFAAPMGRITGLIGPNGAGKTTAFDACGGMNRRISGKIALHDVDVTRRSAPARARLGLGRTFQTMRLADSLTVLENVELGFEAGLAGANVATQVFARRREVQSMSATAMSALEVCGIGSLAQEQAGSLSTGQRRLVELARVLAGDFDVLLLDEPSSGLDAVETAAMQEVLRRVRRERNTAILLVEHDMSLVMNVCDYIYVLDSGQLIFEGDPKAVAHSSVVQAAYLGSSDLEAESGGPCADQEVVP